MEQEKSFLPKPEEGERPSLTPYQEILELTESISEKIEQRKLHEEETRNLCHRIFGNLREVEKLDFFEKLPLAMKLAKLGDLSVFQAPEGTPGSLESLKPESVKRRIEEEGGARKLIEWLAHDGEAMLSNGIIFDIYSKNRSIENLDSERAIMLLDATSRAFIRGNTHQALALKDFLENYSPQFQKLGQMSEDVASTHEQAKRFFSSGYAEIQLAYNIEREEKEHRGFLFRHEGERALAWLKDTLAKYHLPPEEMLKSWLSHKECQPSIGRNITYISDLEKSEPGIAKFLYQNFGIRNFERYPSELLNALFKEYEDLDKPYGILVNPTNDWNGAFSTSWSRWQKLFGQLQEQGYTLRIMEARGKVELAKHLVRLDRRYGSRQKISFAIIGGHGTKDSIQFGGESPINKLYTRDLMGPGAKKASRFFKEEPIIILNSCSSGADRGIGENLSEVMDAEVFAPDKPSSLKTIEVKRGPKGIEFQIEWVTEKEEKLRQVFLKGKKAE